ncbi:MAG TPA: ATP-binding protein [Rhizorhapis sp.]|nr:ATP-binding protein [Rhizorhapis sp.]
MAVGQQNILHERRQYNQWVANETLEDYALRFTAAKARKWSTARVANAALGTVAFLVLEAIGATITLSFGFTNAAAPILIVGVIIFALGLPVSYYAAKYGVDIDLLTRGAGFGYLGSTITSLIYASFTFIFFALEAAVMAKALELCFGLPLFWGYLISALVAIPLVTHGFTFLNRFQFWSQILWVLLQAIPFIAIGVSGLLSVHDWTSFNGRLGPADDGFDPMLFGAAAAVVFALVPQNAEQVDFLRFLPRQRKGRRLGWWTAVICAGPGWIVPGILKMLAGSFLAVLLVHQGFTAESAAQPAQMYLFAFGQAIRDPQIAITLTGIFVVISQLKINVTNAYAGSLAWSNFFSRLTHSHPGRVVWVVFNIALAWLLMELGIYQTLERTLGLYSNIPVAWMGTIFADLAINKPLGLSPRHIEFKRAYLYDINPVGLGAMLTASGMAIALYGGAFGDGYRGLAPFVALGVSILMTPLLALATRSRFYLARKRNPGESADTEEDIRCCVCEHRFEPPDMADCPFYSGPICSLCCSLDVRCDDVCKDAARLGDQWSGLMARILPVRFAAALDQRFARYIALVLAFGAVSAAMLAIVFVQMTSSPGADSAQIAAALHNVFYASMLLIAIAVWPFILANEASRAARQETSQQTAMLMAEIEAHRRTDQQLQQARELADSRNVAKSKYVRGMSHELRTPLNAVLGYAQLLENDKLLPDHIRQHVRVIRRSSDHLAGLVDGLLDISMIEAGRLQVMKEEILLPAFLAQIADMIRLQARQAGLTFTYHVPANLPDRVHTDEKKLRQILINLLSNAVRYTDTGSIALRIRYSGQVARFDIEDSGIGIAPGDLKRIFEPFERIEHPGRAAVTGTGLGLTITRHLSEALGGELTVTSTPGKGSVFSLRLMLSPAPASNHAADPANHIIEGYQGARRTILAVDDDVHQTHVLREFLQTLGFVVLTECSGPAAISRAIAANPDAILLDISMPGMNGWDVARTLRATMPQRIPIVMISAYAPDNSGQQSEFQDAYLMKPLRLDRLLEVLQRQLNLKWIYRLKEDPSPRPDIAGECPAAHHLAVLNQLGQIGHLRGILVKLDEINLEQPGAAPILATLRRLTEDCDLAGYRAAIKDLMGHDA